jgi:hypothetical protein
MHVFAGTSVPICTGKDPAVTGAAVTCNPFHTV